MIRALTKPGRVLLKSRRQSGEEEARISLNYWIKKKSIGSAEIWSSRQKAAGGYSNIQNIKKAKEGDQSLETFRGCPWNGQNAYTSGVCYNHVAAVGHLCLYVLKAHLSERPGELHVLSSAVAALQKPGFAVHVNQTLVVVVVDRRTQHSQVKLLGAGVVHVLLGNRGVQWWDKTPVGASE